MYCKQNFNYLKTGDFYSSEWKGPTIVVFGIGAENHWICQHKYPDEGTRNFEGSFAKAAYV